MKSSRRSTVSQRSGPRAKALGTLCVALWTFSIAAAAGPASAEEVPNRIRIEYESAKSEKYQTLANRLKANDACRQQAVIDVSSYPPDTHFPWFESNVKCGKRGRERRWVDARPNWKGKRGMPDNWEARSAWDE